MAKSIHLNIGNGYEIIDRQNKKWRFEHHIMGAPSVVDKHGEPLERQPDFDSAFWEAVELWEIQGCRVINKNFCKWDKPRLPRGMTYAGGGKYEYEI